MQWRAVLLALLLTWQAAGCGGGGAGGGGSGADPSQPTGELRIHEPTTEPTYTTFQGSLNFSGTRSAAITEVTWANLSTGAAGQGAILDYPDTCCILFTCWDCVSYLWGAPAVPLQEGENQIRIYGNGKYAAGIQVTLAPSLDLSGYVRFNGRGEFNIKLTLTSTTNSAASFSTYTDSAGHYRFRYIPADTYRLQPEDENFVSAPCISFTPASSEVAASGTFDFAAARTLATLSGAVTDAAAGYGVFAVVTLSDATGPALAQRSTNPLGNYAFTCVPDGSYTLTPAADPFFRYVGYTPSARSVTLVGGADALGQDFQGYH